MRRSCRGSGRRQHAITVVISGHREKLPRIWARRQHAITVVISGHQWRSEEGVTLETSSCTGWRRQCKMFKRKRGWRAKRASTRQ